MSVLSMKFRKAAMTGLTLTALGVSLAGCVVYPSGYAYNSYGYGGGYGGGYGYAPGYYAPPPVVGSVIIGGGWGRGWGGGGWGGGWGGRHWR